MPDNNELPNHSLKFYHTTTILGKRVLATLDNATSFPFETQDEQKKTIEFLKRASESK